MNPPMPSPPPRAHGRWRSAIHRIAAVLLLLSSVVAQEHPFIIVRADEYPSLQALCHPTTGREPFIGWRSAAAARADTLYKTADGIRARAFSLNRIMDGLALSYILNPQGRDGYRDRFYAHLRYWQPGVDGSIIDDLTHTSWDASIAPEGAFFATIICMDIMHDDPGTTSEQAAIRAGFRTLMQPMADFTYNPAFAHHFHSHGAARAIWELWVGGATGNPKLDAAVALYKESWRSMTTDDGVFRETGGYAMARAGDPSRYQKGAFHDVIAHSIDPGWYQDPKMRAFYEWLAGYALAPNRYGWPIGDSSYAPFIATYNNAFVRAGNFSPEAAGHAEYFQDGRTRPCDLFAYLCTARGPASPAPRQPGSRIFPDGGAYFIEPGSGTRAMAGVLSNFKHATPTSEPFGHMHRESNTLNLAAFGEIILRGPGYNGWPSTTAVKAGPVDFGFSFRYVNSAAVSANVAMFDYAIAKPPGSATEPSWANEHRAKYGGGGVSGLIGRGLDYAIGDTGPLTDANRTIANGRHIRHFVALYPRDGVNGYFLTLDELEGRSTTTTGNLVWHPYSAHITHRSSERHEWRIRQQANTTEQIHYSIFMPTRPASISEHDGLFADDIQGWTADSYRSFVGRYIFTSYPLPANTRKRNVLTMHFPRISSQATPIMERITTTGGGEGTQGAAFVLDGNTVDMVMESDGSGERGIVSGAHDPVGAVARGKLAMYRRQGGAVRFYFVARGRSFRDAPAGSGLGFTSDADIDLHMAGAHGYIRSDGARVRFRSPGATAVRIGGLARTPVATGPGWVEVDVPAGSHPVEILSASGVNAGPAMGRSAAEPAALGIP